MWTWKLQLIFLIWRPHVISSSNRSLSTCGLLHHILCEWFLVRHYFEWVWAILGQWGWVRHNFWWVGVGGNVWDISLVGLVDQGWVGHYFGWVEVSGNYFYYLNCRSYKGGTSLFQFVLPFSKYFCY